MSTVYSVTSLTRDLKNLIEGKYRFIQVQGEISNLRRPYSGHAYFTLKDEGAQLRSVLFKGQARYLEKAIEDGQQVICHGRLSIYEARGDYQLIVDSVSFQGSGLLQIKFEKLKKQLAAEGLFDSAKKQPIPAFPREIVLLTSPSGAAVHDFLKVWRRREFPSKIFIFPVAVQGEGAGEEISRALALVNRHLPHVDCIVLCRGGGSLEDLWAFNEEVLAREIASSSLPVVSAVGHEIDFTISDFCADLRAPTPTAAAEMIIPDLADTKGLLDRLQRSMTATLSRKIKQGRQQVEQNRRLLGDMNFLFTNVSLRLDHCSSKLFHIMERELVRAGRRCDDLHARIQQVSPVNRLLLQEQRMHFITEKLHQQLRQNLEELEARLGSQVALLDAVSPLATMARGYAIASKIDKKSGKKTLLKDSSQVREDDRLELRLHKGSVDCRVI